MSIHWTKRPTYEEIVADLNKDYKVKLPDRVALNFYDSFAHTQFQQMQQSVTASQQNVDAARDHAMSMANTSQSNHDSIAQPDTSRRNKSTAWR